MKKTSILIIFLISCFCFQLTTNAASATLTVDGPKKLFPIVENGHHFSNTIQIGLKISRITDTLGVSYMKIKIVYDPNIFLCWGGAFYSLPASMGWTPEAGACAEYITVGSDSYYGGGYFNATTNFYAINLKPKDDIPESGTSTIKFEVVAAKDINGDNVSINSPSHTVNLSRSADISTTTTEKNITTEKTTTTTTKIMTTAKKTSTTKRVISSNKDLSTFTIVDFNLDKEFSKDILTYKTTVPFTTDKIEIEATSADATSTIEIIGNDNLKVGINEAQIKVIAEDGGSKIYTLSIERLADDEAEKNSTNNANKCKVLIIILLSIILIIGLVFGTIIYRKRKSKR